MCYPSPSRRNLESNRPNQILQPYGDGNQKVSSTDGRFGLNLSLLFYLGATGGTTSLIPSASAHSLPDPDVDERKFVNPSNYATDPTAAYENNPDWKSTVYASTEPAVDVLKESSDAFTPLKSVVRGLSGILKYYDVRYLCFTKP